MSLVVPMELHGVNLRFLVDTGAVVTVLSSRVYQALPEALRPPLKQPPEALKLEMANDELLAIDGVVDTKFDIDGRNFEHKMYVAPIAEEGLLGMDFLCANDYELGARYGLKLNGLWVCTETRDSASLIQNARVTLKEDVTVPANSQVILPGKAKPGEQKFGSRSGLTKSLPDSNIEGLLVSHLPIDSADHTVPDIDDVVPLMAKSVVSSTSWEQPRDEVDACQPQDEGNRARRHGSWAPSRLQFSWLITLFMVFVTAAQHCWSEGVVLVKNPVQWLGKQAPRVAFPVMGLGRGQRHSREDSTHLQDGCGDPGGTGHKFAHPSGPGH